jgi:hypothetical protein
MGPTVLEVSDVALPTMAEPTMLPTNQHTTQVDAATPNGTPARRSAVCMGGDGTEASARRGVSRPDA